MNKMKLMLGALVAALVTLPARAAFTSPDDVVSAASAVTGSASTVYYGAVALGLGAFTVGIVIYFARRGFRTK